MATGQYLNTSMEMLSTTEHFSMTGMEAASRTVPWDNFTTNAINETLTELNFRYAQSLLPFAFILGVFCFVGILGNSIVIMVFLYSKEYRNTNFKIFVLCLAAVDLMSCVVLMPAEIVKTRHFFSISDHGPCKVKCFFNVFAMNTSGFILLIICIDRYRKVCQPLKKQIQPSLAIKMLTGALVLSLLLTIPAPIMCGVTDHVKRNLNDANITVYVCSAEKKYHHSVLRYIYKLGLSILLVGVAISLIVMYILIMKTVIQHWGKRESGESVRFETSRSQDQDQSAGKVEMDRTSDNEDVFIKTVDGEALDKAFLNRYSGGPQINRKVSIETKRPRSSSATSMSKGRFSVKRSSSDASYRNRILRRQSSSVAAGRLPYKTLIWFILTLIFLVTYIVNAGLSFMTTKEYKFSPTKLFWFQLFFRIYFINNIVNPVIYAWLDKRFKRSFKKLMAAIKRKISCR